MGFGRRAEDIVKTIEVAAIMESITIELGQYTLVHELIEGKQIFEIAEKG